MVNLFQKFVVGKESFDSGRRTTATASREKEVTISFESESTGKTTPEDDSHSECIDDFGYGNFDMAGPSPDMRSGPKQSRRASLKKQMSLSVSLMGAFMPKAKVEEMSIQPEFSCGNMKMNRRASLKKQVSMSIMSAFRGGSITENGPSSFDDSDFAQDEDFSTSTFDTDFAAVVQQAAAAKRDEAPQDEETELRVVTELVSMQNEIAKITESIVTSLAKRVDRQRAELDSLKQQDVMSRPFTSSPHNSSALTHYKSEIVGMSIKQKVYADNVLNIIQDLKDKLKQKESEKEELANKVADLEEQLVHARENNADEMQRLREKFMEQQFQERQDRRAELRRNATSLRHKRNTPMRGRSKNYQPPLPIGEDSIARAGDHIQEMAACIKKTFSGEGLQEMASYLTKTKNLSKANGVRVCL